jgi:ABC-type nickel/cobalt efflux system permease component RcnA
MSVTLPSFYQQLLGASTGSFASAILLTMLLGVVHAASPGHGKTLVVATLLGTRGSMGRVLLLAAMVAVTHTAGVMLLALVVLTANDALLPQQVTPFISLAAAILVVLFGLDLARRALQARSRPHAHVEQDDHDHHHPHPAPIPELTRGYTLSIGLVGGLVPNGTALVVLLTAIAFHELWLGVLLVATFGLGIAAALAAVGMAAVLVRGRGGRLAAGEGVLYRALSTLPLVSGLAVVAVGVVLTAQAATKL